MRFEIRKWESVPSLLALVVIGIACFALVSRTAYAASIPVSCDVPSLISALNTANTNAGADTLELDANCVYTLTAVDNTDGSLGPNGLPVITSDITISGNGATIARDSGAPSFRLFQVNSGAALRLQAVTLAGGSTTYPGGGIHNRGTVTVEQSTLTHNSGSGGGGIWNHLFTNLVITNTTFISNTAGADWGGAISNVWTMSITDSSFENNFSSSSGGAIANSGSATVTDTGFTDNVSNGWGGAIFNNQTLEVSDSNFTHNQGSAGGAIKVGLGFDHSTTIDASEFISNTASDGSGGAISSSAALTITESAFLTNSSTTEFGGNGGAIAASDTAQISDSTFTGNSANGDGGAIHTYSDTFLTLANDTFSGNTAVGNGGAIVNNRSLVLSNSTLYQNTATNSGGGIYSFGSLFHVINSTLSANSSSDSGGIYMVDTGTISNTIIANSTAGNNCSGDPLTNGGGNIRYPAADTSCNGTFGDPKLGALQDNGGPTFTMALLAGSAAIDAGSDVTCAAAPINDLDQRGVVRPSGTHCDSGAFEAVSSSATQTPTTTLTPTATRTHTPSSTPTRTNTPTVTVTVCGAIPAPPTLLSPAKNATVKKAKVPLDWSDVACATSYQVKVKSAATGKTVFTKTVTVSSAKTKALAAGAYKWTVKACNAAGCASSKSKFKR